MSFTKDYFVNGLSRCSLTFQPLVRAKSLNSVMSKSTFLTTVLFAVDASPLGWLLVASFTNCSLVSLGASFKNLSHNRTLCSSVVVETLRQTGHVTPTSALWSAFVIPSMHLLQKKWKQLNIFGSVKVSRQIGHSKTDSRMLSCPPVAILRSFT